MVQKGTTNIYHLSDYTNPVSPDKIILPI